MNLTLQSGRHGLLATVRLWLLAGGLGGMLGVVLTTGSAARAEGVTMSQPPIPSTSPNLGEALKPSTADQQQLSDFLRRRGVLFYGAWWCPACFRQKSLFGQEAGKQLPYVECDKTEAGRERCRADGIKAYPTWVMGGQRLEGVQTLEELRNWSGFGKSSQSTTP
jgi:hypothetical protein